jgi:hypothetical protein
MRSSGLTAADWQVVNEYISVLQPLKEATKRLEGRGKSGRFGAIYEVIPVFEYLLDAFEEHVRPFEDVDYEQYDAPKDHLERSRDQVRATLHLAYQMRYSVYQNC